MAEHAAALECSLRHCEQFAEGRAGPCRAQASAALQLRLRRLPSRLTTRATRRRSRRHGLPKQPTCPDSDFNIACRRNWRRACRTIRQSVTALPKCLTPARAHARVSRKLSSGAPRPTMDHCWAIPRHGSATLCHRPMHEARSPGSGTAVLPGVRFLHSCSSSIWCAAQLDSRVGSRPAPPYYLGRIVCTRSCCGHTQPKPCQWVIRDGDSVPCGLETTSPCSRARTPLHCSLTKRALTQ